MAMVIVMSGLTFVATAEECGWLPVEKLDEAYPQYAPWVTLVGGKVGSCKFSSDPRKPANIFGANQMVQASVAEAEDFVRSLRSSMAESYDVEAAKTLGSEAFVYRPKPEAGAADRSLFFVGHRQQVVVIGSLTFQSAITPSEREAGEALLGAALALSSDAGALAAASQCSWFDPRLIRRLLPGHDYSEHVFGSVSCMANAGGKVVMLSIVESEDTETLVNNLDNMVDTACASESIPSLGKLATIQYDCVNGNPKASVRFVSGTKMFELSLAPEKEPTEEERTLLIELAEHMLSK
jgi:hypothetical protein